MRHLVDFLNHGILPYVGRTAEAEQILAFWRGTVDSHGLRGALLVGEAGTGKSRFVEEIIPEIVRSGGLVVHTKLYPESTTALAPLIAQAVWRSAGTAHLVKSEPEETLPAVTGALRRLSRLRQTLLIIEDVHLLSNESLREFAALLDSFADDSISILCSTRPVESSVRGILERCLIDQIELKGLPQEELKRLWSEVFGSEGDPESIRLLYQTTHGNLLALRSALRGGVKAGDIAPSPAGTGWNMVVPPEQFAETLRRNILLLSEGMAAHLNEEERRSAALLARLGEIFSREGAQALLDDEGLIDILTFKGILGLAVTNVAPLPGPRSSHALLTFTHTLLHSYFLGQPIEAPGRIVDLLAGGLPLYSVLPYQIVAEPEGAMEVPGDRLRQGIDRALHTVFTLNTSPDWHLGKQVWQGAMALYQRGVPGWSERERYLLESELLHHDLMIRGRTHDDALDQRIESFLSLTANLPSDEFAHYRLQALAHLYLRCTRKDYGRCAGIAEEVEVLLGEHPWLRRTDAYVRYLRAMVIAARAADDAATIDRFETLLTGIIGDNEADEEFRLHAREILSPFLLDVFQTEEQMRERLAMLDELERGTRRASTSLPWQRVILMYELGRHHEAFELIPHLLPRLRDFGLQRSLFQCRMLRCCIRLTFGDPLGDIEREIREILAEAPPDYIQMLSGSICSHVTLAALLRGEWEWGRRMFEEFEPGALNISLTARCVLSLLSGMGFEPSADTGDQSASTITSLYAGLLGDEAPNDQSIESIGKYLGQPLVRMDILIMQRAMIVLVEQSDARHSGGNMAERLRSDIRGAILRGLDWLAERELFACAGALLERHGGYLNGRELKGWRARIVTGMRDAGRKRSGPAGGERMRLSMLGVIEMVRADGEIARPRGSRLRTLLGLMVADSMLERPLTNREFYCLAAGDDDIERARNTVHAAMHRLRESIGPDALIADADKPMLNPATVDVDLLQANRLLREASAAAREGAWMRASSAAIEALRITRGEVPFPSLYETFFEAAREDFENDLRSTAIRIARGLLREDDPASAREVLAAAFDVIPDDDEISTLLYDALSRMGRRAEAERIKLRVAEAMAM